MGVTKAQQRAVTKYMKENYDEIKLRVPKGLKAVIQEYAQYQNMSVNSFIGQLIADEFARNSDLVNRITIELEERTQTLLYEGK